MNQASLYHHANQVQRFDASRILNEYAHVIQWRSDGCDSLLDIGCGTGDVLMDFVYPLLPKKFQRLTGIDISRNMVQYAKNHYTQDKVEFLVFNICKKKLPMELYGKYDHIVSFYCLHWIHNQRQVLKNMYYFLGAKGDVLLVFLSTNFIYNIYETLSKMDKWQPYMQDVKNFISPQHYMHNPVKEFQQLLQNVGFSNVQVELRNEVFTYVGSSKFRNNVRSICPFLERIPFEMHDLYLDDFENEVEKLNLKEFSENEEKTQFKSPYKLIVAYAQKQ